MQQLMRDAHIHIVWSFQPSGLKLKTVNALFQARHIVANSNALSGLPEGLPCHRAEKIPELVSLLTTLMQQPFAAADLEARRTAIGQYLDNIVNAHILIETVFGVTA